MGKKRVFDRVLGKSRQEDIGEGTGIFSLNGLTSASQNFAVGTDGTDFNINSLVDLHTFNLPTASATNRGALSKEDWTIFNDKWGDLAQIVRVAKSGGDFTSPQAAVDSITDATYTKKYVLLLGPGFYDEDTTLKPNIGMVGLGTWFDVGIRKVIANFAGAEYQIASLKNLYVQDIEIGFTNSAYSKALLLDRVYVTNSITASGENENPASTIHILKISDCQIFANLTFNNRIFVSSEGGTIIASSNCQLNNYSILQHGGGELNGVFTINNSAKAFVSGGRVLSFPLDYSLTFNVNNSGLLNLDANTFSTCKIIKGSGVTDSQIQIMEGVSAGMISVIPTYTDNLDGTITVHEGQCFIYDNDHQFGLPRRFIIPQKTLTLTNLVNNYVQVNYNSGIPQYENVTTETANDSDKISFYRIYKSGTELHAFNWDALGEGLPNKLHRRIVDTNPFALKSGLGLGEAPTRLITIGSGSGYYGAVPFLFDAFNSSADDLYFYYWNGSAWVEDKTKTQYNNSQYQGPTGLVSALPNKYLINFIYRGLETEAHCYFVLGTQEYPQTAAGLIEAQEANPPASLPPIIVNHAFLVGKIIVLTAATTATSIQSAFVKQFQITPSTDHGALSGLSDDDHTQYLLLAGRNGGQTLNGGTLTAQNLSLRANYTDLTSGQVNFLDTKEATTISSAAATFAGGIGVAKQIMSGSKVIGHSTIEAWNTNDLDTLQVLFEGNVGILRATAYGGGTYRPLALQTSDVNRLYITTAGKIGLGGITAPSAWLHLPAGSATANNAPLKFTSGINLTAPEAGSMEYNNDFYLTLSTGTRYKIPLISGTDYEPPVTKGNLTGTANRLGVTGGTGAVIGAGASLNVDTTLLPSPLLADAGKALIATGANAATWQTLPSGMVYPSAGIALSTGSAWGTSITDNSANWNTAYGWGDHASAGYLKNIVEDTTPQLGGDLDTNSNDIKFLDNDKAIFGTGLDGEFYSDGNDIILRQLTQDKDFKFYINKGGIDTLALRIIGSTGNANFDGFVVSAGVFSASGNIIPLQLQNDGAVRAQISCFSNTPSNAPTFQGTRGNGTGASPTAITANTVIFDFRALGYYDAVGGNSRQGQWGFKATENWSVTNKGTSIFFEGTPTGSATRSEFFQFLDGAFKFSHITGIAESAVLSFTEKDTTPANPTQDVEVKTYMKGDKFIWQFNNGGTVRYFFIDLTQTAAQQIQHTTTAP